MSTTTNGHKVRRYRQFTLTLPGDVADRLIQDHRDVVADAIKAGDRAVDFDEFVQILLDMGRRAVLGSAASPAPAPAPEATT